MIEDTDSFGFDDGLNFAIAFSAYDSSREYQLPPEYGEIAVNHLSWGPDPNGGYYLIRERLDTHICTREELGLVEGGVESASSVERAAFFPIKKKWRSILDLYQQKFICLDRD